MRGIETQTTDLYLAFCGNLPREVCKVMAQTVRTHHQKGLVVKDINFLGEHMMTHYVWGITAYFDHDEAELYSERERECQWEGDERGAAYWRSRNAPHDELFVFRYGGVPHPCQVPFKCPDLPNDCRVHPYMDPATWRALWGVM